MDKVGFIAVTLAAFFWGTMGIAGKQAFSTGVDPLTIALIRALVPFLLLFCYMILFDRKKLFIKKKDVGLFAFFGFIAVAMFNVSYFTAIKLTSVTTAAILLYTSPAFVIFLAYFMLGESITRNKILTVVLTLVGCWLVVRGYDFKSLTLNLPGILCGLASGVTYALYSVIGRRLTRDYHSLTVVFYAFGFGALFLSFIKSPLSIAQANFSWTQWMYILYIATFGALVAHSLYTWGLSKVESGVAAVVATFEPIVAALLAFFILDEVLELWQILGVFIVIAAVMLVNMGQKEKRQDYTNEKVFVNQKVS